MFLRLAGFLCALTLCGQAFGAPIDHEARTSLKKWGAAYCLYKNGGPIIGQEASRAMAGYFERGRHDSENAYQNIREFMDAQYATISKASKEMGADLVLLGCLDIAESEAYQKLIQQQDRYVGSEVLP